jgi:membrane-bound lytic murein transglycosylase D
MAGYNWGAGNVQRAVEKTGYADFWELYKRHNLPAETANYVPEILAAIIVANNPTKYGFDDITLDPPVLTDTVTINYSIDLRLVSDLVGASVEELQALNPSLLRRMTPPDAAFDLHLPGGTASLFQQRVATVPESHRNAWRYRRVTAGDTMASVAREYRLSASELAAANQLSEDDDLKKVEALAIPQAQAVAPTAAARASALYTARKGDTLVTIADRYGVSLTQLRRWNKLSGDGVKVVPGRKLQVIEPATVAPRGKGGRRHRGASGAATSPSTEAPSTPKSSSKTRGKGSKAQAAESRKEPAEKKVPSAHGKHSARSKAEPAEGKSSPQSAHKPSTKHKRSK